MSIAQIDSALRRGLGFAGKVLGTQFSVYRIGGKTGSNGATSVIDTLNLTHANFAVRFVHQEPKVVIENEEIYKMLYLGMCDTRTLKVGDVFVETGPKLADTPDGRIFTLADVQPLLPAVFARTEIYGALSRPDSASGNPEPLLGGDVYAGETKFTEMICSYVDGQYEIPGTTTPAVIPMGIQPHTRKGAPQEFKFPTATHRGVYYGYSPLLSGVQIESGDVISDQNGNRYVVQNATVFTVGIQGWFLQMESLFT